MNLASDSLLATTHPLSIRQMRLFLFLLGFVALFPSVRADVIFGKVVSVHDGDTLTLLLFSKGQRKIRLWGIV